VPAAQTVARPSVATRYDDIRGNGTGPAGRSLLEARNGYCGPMLGHRFQVLLDEERYQRVAALARERGVSTETIVQEALDRSLSASHAARSEAAWWMLGTPNLDVPADPASAELDARRAPSSRTALDWQPDF
jgi:hypothetical protein